MYTVEMLKALGTHTNLELFLLCSPDFEWQQIPGTRTLPVLQRLSHPIPVLRKARFVTAQWVNPFRILRTAEKKGIEVVHLQSFHHLSFAQWKVAASRSSVKWVISAHDIKRDVAIFHKNWEDEQLRASYQFADAILVHSNFQKEELVGFAHVDPLKVHLVPHGPYVYAQPADSKESIRLKLGIPQSVDVALFFGQVRNDKNLSSFLRALSIAKMNTHLIVAGQPGGHHQDAAYYRALCEELQLEERVHFFFGHVPDERVGQYFTAADWIALPYRQSFTSQSGVLNIAAQFNRPVLVSSAPVLKETVLAGGIGYACLGDGVEELKQGIVAMQEVKVKVQRKNFDQYRKEYSWKRSAELCVELYEKLVS